VPINRLEQIVAELRREIVEGAFPPGERLPTRLELETRFEASPHTIQRAMNRLKQDGFILASRRVGTYVAENPPHICNFGLVIPASGRRSRFYAALREAVGFVENGHTVRFGEYYSSREVGSREDVARLCRDVRSHRVAGLILAGPPDDLVGTPALEQAGVPRVVTHSMLGFGLPMILPDGGSFLDRAVEYLVARGRRHIAHLCVDFPWYHMEEFEGEVKRRGVEVRPYWTQAIPLGTLFRTAASVVNLLMHLKGEDRPDALIIHDDNLVEHAVAGLLAAGVKVPQELDVVAHSNYPSPVPSVLPLKRLGFDCRQILVECLRVLQMQRRGEEPPAVTEVPAVFEDELDTGPSEAPWGDPEDLRFLAPGEKREVWKEGKSLTGRAL